MAVSLKNRARFRQLAKFGVVGLGNTALDFFIFNFCSKFLMLPLIAANTISTTIAMLVSFAANRRLVFKADGSAARQIVLFYIVTAFGLYVVQNGVIHILAVIWPVPLMAGVRLVRHLGVHWFSDAFYLNNGAKAVGTVFSLAWNFVMYKKVVFK